MFASADSDYKTTAYPLGNRTSSGNFVKEKSCNLFIKSKTPECPKNLRRGYNTYIDAIRGGSHPTVSVVGQSSRIVNRCGTMPGMWCVVCVSCVMT